jgi:LCP family protein required for cell wall assembly
MLIALGGIAQGQDSASIDESVPDPVSVVDEGDQDIRNYILLGSDNAHATNIGRTDVMVIVSANLSAQTIAMLSLPRDLHVFVPGVGMSKINTAFAYGEADGMQSGFVLLKETVLYNLGLSIDGFARVNFAGFRDIIDSLGGIEIAVDCGIQDWRLISADLDPNDEANWEMFTLPIGIHELDGDTALWYLRSRRTSSDFDRGRRHQIVLRAILKRAQQAGLLPQLTQVWPQMIEVVETNISLDDLLPLIPIATSLSPERVATYRFEQNVDVRSSRAPDGGAVQVTVPAQVETLMIEFLTPPTSLQIGREQPRVWIGNASGINDLGDVAAERLRWEGFQVEIGETLAYQYESELVDLSGSAKNSSREIIQSLLRIDDEEVIVDPQSERRVDFRVTLGGGYYACTHNVIPPSESTPSA